MLVSGTGGISWPQDTGKADHCVEWAEKVSLNTKANRNKCVQLMINRELITHGLRNREFQTMAKFLHLATLQLQGTCSNKRQHAASIKYMLK